MIAFFARDGEHVALEIRDQSADLRVRFRRHFIKQLLDFLKLFFLRCASFRLFRNGRADYAAGDAFVRSLAQRQVGLKLRTSARVGGSSCCCLLSSASSRLETVCASAALLDRPFLFELGHEGNSICRSASGRRLSSIARFAS